MDIRQLKDPGRKIAAFAGQLVILIICIGFIEFIYYGNIYPDKLVKESFEETNCRLVSKNLTTVGRVLHRYRADFLLNYTVGNTSYQNWASGNGLDRSFSTDQDLQQEELDQFEENGIYPCWYNPEAPQIIVLVLRHSWSSTFPLFIPSVIALIMIYYIARGIYEFLAVTSVKTRERVRRRKQNKNK